MIYLSSKEKVAYEAFAKHADNCDNCIYVLHTFIEFDNHVEQCDDCEQKLVKYGTHCAHALSFEEEWSHAADENPCRNGDRLHEALLDAGVEEQEDEEDYSQETLEGWN